jgi:RND family efflux transporter MFP subunit
MQKMKKSSLVQIPLLALALLPFACGKPPVDKAAQLAALKEQKAKIEAQITQLEKETGAGANAAPKVKTVGITPASSVVFRHYIDLQGKIDAEDNVQVTSKMPGALTNVLVRNGDNVHKGQLLAEMDDAILLKSLAELDVQLKTAQDVYNRQKGLWDQKIGTEMQFIQAKTQKESIEQRIATTKEQWSQSKIYAPIAGAVDMVLLKNGQSIAPGVPLCNIVNLGRLKIKGEVPESYAAKVRQGDVVNVQFPDIKKEITTKVSYVSKSINPTNRTFTVECALPTADFYRANMIAILKITDYQNPNAIVVPVNVIQTSEEGDFVLVAEKTDDKQGTVKKVAVKQGNNYDGLVEILSGLKKGDAVITTGFQDVNSGETVSY